ncbi:MAG: ABC transporter ATP-binding protein, partial [Myxococcales bacterium]|nr:ABC transporter ATP-binding protein [Myxococcales bacterium]
VAMGRVPHQARRIVVTATDREAVEGAIDACELSALAGRAIESLSGGEQQRVHVARALAQQTPVLLLDEAAAHLDLRHTTQLFELVRREITARRLTCVAALHDLATAGRFADMALLLGEGRLIAAGTVDDVMTRAKLEEAFATALRCGKTPEGDRYFVPV